VNVSVLLRLILMLPMAVGGCLNAESTTDPVVDAHVLDTACGALATRCAGAAIEQCGIGGWTTVVDCASSGMKCAVDGGVAGCVPLAADPGVDGDVPHDDPGIPDAETFVADEADTSAVDAWWEEYGGTLAEEATTDIEELEETIAEETTPDPVAGDEPMDAPEVDDDETAVEEAMTVDDTGPEPDDAGPLDVAVENPAETLAGDATADQETTVALVMSGTVDGSGDYGEVVKIFHTMSGVSMMCSGTLLAPNVVLTAAHCVCHCPAEVQECDLEENCDTGDAFAIYLYDSVEFDDASQTLHVAPAGVHVHPEFHMHQVKGLIDGQETWLITGTVQADVAVLVTSECASQKVVPAHLAETASVIGEPATVVGFGTFECGSPADGQRRFGEVHVDGLDPEAHEITVTGPVIASQGDSGGPLFRSWGHGSAALPRAVLGVISRGSPACDANPVTAYFEDHDLAVALLATVVAPECCWPSCAGKACGDDGCGTSCGTCSGGSVCQAGQCACTPEHHRGCSGDAAFWFDSCGIQGAKIADCPYGCTAGECLPCVPACGGKTCGDDGCGGSCGSCQAGAICLTDRCVCLSQDHFVCSGSAVYWADSCGVPGAKVSDCPYGCAGGECLACSPSCVGKACGSDGCGGSCGGCVDGKVCSGGQCLCLAQDHVVCSGAAVYWADSCGALGAKLVDCPYGCQGGACKPCQPSCAGKACGDDGCGSPCGTCGGGSVCQAGQCVCTPGHHRTCSGDAAFWVDSCGIQGAKIADCPYGCTAGECLPCVPACGGKTCGNDGCGGSCGTCQNGSVCSGGLCVCTPQDHRVCSGSAVYWADSCGVVGAKVEDCPYGCQVGTCLPCVPACTGKCCGIDGCGGTCGSCTSPQSCLASGACGCVAHDHRACRLLNGLESAWWANSCGDLESIIEDCVWGCANGFCLGCTPKCSGKECGDDGCGSTCGTCGTGTFCQAGTCSDPCPDGYALIRPGEFDMGSPTTEPGRSTVESRHHVKLNRGMCMAKSPVTQVDFAALTGKSPSYFVSCGSTCPVEMVNWYEAIAYVNLLSTAAGLPNCYTVSGQQGTLGGGCTQDTSCQGSFTYATVVQNPAFLPARCPGYRLPTEAEYEYATRAGTTTSTYGGALDSAHLACEEPNAVLDAYSWFCGNGSVTYPGSVTYCGTPTTTNCGTHPVKGKTANPWGLYDMNGNVGAWNWDWSGTYGTQATSNDPQGPTSGTYRVIRGASFRSGGASARSAFRGANLPSYRYDSTSIRPVRTVPLGHCVVEGLSVPDGQFHPANRCQLCDVMTSPSGYSPWGEGSTCSEPSCAGLVWTPSGECHSGECVAGATKSCNDGLACTTDSCAAPTGCSNALQTGYCLVDGACYADGQVNPANACQVCSTSSSTTAWTNVADGSWCTPGTCSGTLLILPKTCSNGTCTGLAAARSCNDGLACTDDSCAPAGCTNAIQAGNCAIGGACYVDGTLDPSNVCRSCVAVTSNTSWTAVADGTQCLPGSCDGLASYTTPKECYSGKCNSGGYTQSCSHSGSCYPTTSCDPETGCQHTVSPGYCYLAGTCVADGTPNSIAPCQYCRADVNPFAWTNEPNGVKCGGDACDGLTYYPIRLCSNGYCGGDNAVGCTDVFSCTTDSCAKGTGCSHVIAASSCKIGNTCYSSGQTNPNKPSQVCLPAVSQTAWTDVCTIGGIQYPEGYLNPANLCKLCRTSSSTTAWSNQPDGMTCGPGQTCKSGVCSP
jgi:formylglycine-generating enzyme required for sulfatase activity